MAGENDLMGAAPALGADATAMPTEKPQSEVKRDVPEPDASRRALVKRWNSEIKADKEWFKDVYKRIKEDMEYALLGGKKEWVDGGNYTVPIIGRQINQEVAALYAKNPKAIAKRKPKLNFKLWDGTVESAQAAFQGVAIGDPMSIEIMTEIQQAKTNNVMLSRMARTLEILFSYYTGESTPNFKQQMKQHVRRAKTCGVSYVELGYQRVLETDPEVTARIDDMTQKIAVIESKLADVTDGITSEGDADLEQLRLDLRDLQDQENILVREGVEFDFIRTREIIPHRKCKQLRGFVGADYVTREFQLSAEEVQEIYKIDIGKSYTQYADGAEVLGGDGSTKNANVLGNPGKDTSAKAIKATVWRVQDKKNRQIFTIIDGYPDFVKEPVEHPLQVDGFYTIFPLDFNGLEDEKEIIPRSDVHNMKHPQKEFNSVRQGLREHRKANRPKYFVRAGVLSEKERGNLQSHAAHAVIELQGMDSETPIDSLITGFKPVPIDPNLYETGSILKDVLYSVGSQSADLGPTTNSTATESTISEQGKQSATSSNVDDLDEHLSDLARATGQVMLAELSLQTVQEIVGPGAVWPELDREQISKELYLEIKAGSSGRPNKAAELANMERGMPYLIQLGGVSGTVLAKRYSDLLDIDEEELIIEGLPSIVAMNAMAAKAGTQPQPGPGAGKDAPAQQGGHGANNAAAPGQKMNNNEPGAQPQFPGATINGQAQ